MSKVLIVYFSRTGRTKAVAEAIAAATGGALYEIVPQKPYDGNYPATIVKAKIENITNARPAIVNLPDDIGGYDTVFVGFPNWWGSAPRIMATFAEHYDWSGKTVIPFFTHGGGGAQRCESGIRALMPAANFREPLCLFDKKVADSQEEIAAWLKKLGF